MKFSTHEERMQHSQASEEHVLLDRLKAIPLPSSTSEILCLWLGIAFSHPELIQNPFSV
ncbi:hypothetical protein [Legionella bozemanae]|uniref:hypothetical protein n=1 Tax=Legionella bozemanae TaxID=447 RepID=UPI0013EF9BE7|nr:hypothetical protein [Legionella bozemanae]